MLYFHRISFKCRQCARLNYSSQQVTKGPNKAAHRMIRFIQSKFGVEKSLSPAEAEWYIPKRPKGMHQKTYERLREELEELQERYSREWVAHIYKMCPFIVQAIQRSP